MNPKLEKQAMEKFISYLAQQDRAVLSQVDLERINKNIIRCLDGGDTSVILGRRIILNKFFLNFLIYNPKGCEYFLKLPLVASFAVGIRTLFRIEMADE